MSAISNAKWIAVSQVARLLSQVANIVILARFLSPSDYGLMGMAMVVTNLALLLRDMGTAAAIIQIKEIDDEIITSVFWLNIILGFLVCIIILLTSTFVSGYFNAPALTLVLCGLSLVFPISSFTSAQKALLERKSAFRPVAQAEILSIILSMILAVLAAVAGWGVYSFVVQSISAAIIASMLVWIASDWHPSLKPSLSKINEVLPFSGHMTGFQIIFYCTRNLDTVVIGKMLGANALGMYSVASKIMLLPIQNISWIASRALYPVMSRHQERLEETGKLFIQTVAFISFITAPLMVGIFVLRESFVLHALGARWVQVSGILIYLAPIGYIQSIVGINTTVLMAQGKTKYLMFFSIFSGSVLAISFILGAKFGVEGVALGYLVASILSAIPALYMSTKLIRVSILEWMYALIKSISLALAMGLILKCCSIYLGNYINSNIIIFALVILLGVVVYTALSYIFIPEQINSIIKQLRKSKNK